jgi:hypothetical protein
VSLEVPRDGEGVLGVAADPERERLEPLEEEKELKGETAAPTSRRRTVRRRAA